MTEPTTPTGKRLALREVRHPHGVRELDLCGLCMALAIEAEAREQLLSHVPYIDIDDLACSCGWNPHWTEQRDSGDVWIEHLREAAKA